MITGTTSNGFNYEIGEEALDDYELLEALASVDRGNFEDIVIVVKLLLGEYQLDKLKDHLRKGGRVSSRAIVNVIKEIFEECNKGKNSLSSPT